MKTPQADETTHAYLVTCIVPPANITRKILDMRRLIFSASKQSGNALSPAVATLAVRRLKARPTVTKSNFDILRRSSRIAESWCQKIETNRTVFRSGTIHRVNDAAFLGLLSIPDIMPDAADCTSGSNPSRLKSSTAASGHGLSRVIDFLLPGAGFFICRIDDDLNMDPLQPWKMQSFFWPETGSRYLEFGFRDCSIDVYHVETGGPEREYSIWHQLASRRVHSGT